MIKDVFQTSSSNWAANARFAEGLHHLDEYGAINNLKALTAAKDAFCEAIQAEPRFQNAHFHLAIARELAGEHDEAIAEFEGLLDEANPPAELLYNLGLAWFHLYRRDAYEKAIGFFDQAIAAVDQPQDAGVEQFRQTIIRLLAKVGKAQVYAHQMLPETGLTSEQAKAAGSGAQSEAGEVLDDLRRLSGKPEFGDGTLLNDAKWGALNALGHAAMTEGRRGDEAQLVKAIGYFKEADNVDPGNFRVQSNLGSAHFYLASKQNRDENLRKAKAAFDRVLASRPDYDFAYYRLAGIANALKQFDTADLYLAKARAHPSEMTTEVLDRLAQTIKDDRDRSAAVAVR